jgi:GTPase SAR1 family protein
MKEYKITFIGDTESGKTSIVSRFTGGDFKDEVETSNGTSFYTKVYTKEITLENEINAKLDIHDTDGENKYYLLPKKI